MAGSGTSQIGVLLLIAMSNGPSEFVRDGTCVQAGGLADRSLQVATHTRGIGTNVHLVGSLAHSIGVGMGL